jgi:hypothetical protein
MNTHFTPTTISVSLADFELVESDFYAASSYHAPRNVGLILPGLGRSVCFILFVRKHQKLAFPILKS